MVWGLADDSEDGEHAVFIFGVETGWAAIVSRTCGASLEFGTLACSTPQSVLTTSSQSSSRLRDQNLGELRHPHGSDYWVRYGPNISGQNEGANDDKGKDCNYLGSGDYRPEKAALYHFCSSTPLAWASKRLSFQQ